ncbi:MAG: desulfoferrodoxin [Deltaproteobacteria bacterium]|nr:desulfoferrodoxin [Deltaproteobacteria bacterium]
MNRRMVLKTALYGGAALAFGNRVAAAKEHFPVSVNEGLFQNINRIKDPAHMTGLEKKHSPVIRAPEKAKPGEVFDVDIVIGEILHPMGPAHWIEYLQLNLGNEPCGRIDFRSHGYLKPKARFSVVAGNDLKGKTVSLVVQIKCNLHGIWENYRNVEVV